MFTDAVVGVDGRQDGRDAIALARQLIDPDGLITQAPISRRDGPAGRGLRRLALERSADVLVIGSSHQRGLGRALPGAETSGTLNGATCAVAIAPPGYGTGSRPIRTVGVGHDGSPESEQALQTARDVVAHHGAVLEALAVVSLESVPGEAPIPDDWPQVSRRLIAEQRRRLRGLRDVPGEVACGDPGEELERFAQALDLLVVGSRGDGPLGRLFHGSTSQYLARHAPCPLLILPRGARARRSAEQRVRTSRATTTG